MHQQLCFRDGRAIGEADPAAFRSAMRNFAAGVAIIATGTCDARRGMTATSACSLSDSPPSVLVSILKTAETHDALLTNRAFSLNITALEHQDLANRFAGRHAATGAAKFDQGDWGVGLTGSPILLDAVATLDCELDRALDGGTHTIAIGFVREIFTNSPRQPLVYHAGAFGTVLRAGS